MKIKSLVKLEVAVSFLLLMFYMGALGMRIPIGTNHVTYGTAQSNLIERIMAPLSYLLIPFLISRKWKLCIYLLTKDLTLILLLFLVSFSIIWTDPNLVVQNLSKIRGLLLSSMFGVYLAARFSIREQTRLLAGVFGIVILFSILAALFVPGYGIHPATKPQLAGYWTGIFAHKNALGAHMAWSASIFLSLSLSISRNHLGRLALWTGFALSFLLVFLAGSAGGLVNLLSVICIIPLSKFLKKTHYKLQVLLIITLILLSGGIFILVVANAPTIAEALGKDLTFTGRLPLWHELLGYIAQKPLLGYGFNGFWDSDQYGEVFRARWVWHSVPNAHNGFVELLLALGLLGFLLFVMSFILQFLRAYKQVYRAKIVEDVVPMQFLLTFSIFNISESRLLMANNIYWIIYIAMALSLAVKYRQERKLRATEKVNNI